MCTIKTSLQLVLTQIGLSKTWLCKWSVYPLVSIFQLHARICNFPLWINAYNLTVRDHCFSSFSIWSSHRSSSNCICFFVDYWTYCSFPLLPTNVRFKIWFMYVVKYLLCTAAGLHLLDVAKSNKINFCQMALQKLAIRKWTQVWCLYNSYTKSKKLWVLTVDSTYWFLWSYL